jgi:hypothetical protein
LPLLSDGVPDPRLDGLVELWLMRRFGTRSRWWPMELRLNTLLGYATCPPSIQGGGVTRQEAASLVEEDASEDSEVVIELGRRR